MMEKMRKQMGDTESNRSKPDGNQPTNAGNKSKANNK
jgi:hypothetical protein